jgi:hypothetical protein
LAFAKAEVAVNVRASSGSSAMAFAKTGSKAIPNNSPVCSQYFPTTDLRYLFCLEARGEGEALAEAAANATGTSWAISGGGNTGALSVYVDAANIEEFNATVSTGAGSFAAAHASAWTNVYFDAYSKALAEVNLIAKVECQFISGNQQCTQPVWNTITNDMIHAMAFGIGTANGFVLC